MGSEMTQEKRKFSRVLFKMNAKFIQGEQEVVVGEIANLSVGGCQLDIDAGVEVGAECTVVIELNPADSTMNVEVGGEVVRVEGGSVSIRFLAIDPEDLGHLHNIIRYNAEDPDRIEEEINDHPGLV